MFGRMLLVFACLNGVPAARAAILQDASCVLDCLIGSRAQENDQGNPTVVADYGQIYVEFENLGREELEQKLSDFSSFNTLCKKKFGNEARAESLRGCRYFRHE